VRCHDSLRGRSRFALVLRRGRSASTKHLSVSALYARGRDRRPKVGIVITKKVGNAVTRNRLRRRCKAIVDQSDAIQSGTWFVIACRPSASALAFTVLKGELAGALQESSRKAGQVPLAREGLRR
jgi:ribonuclease P protein component